MTTKELECAVYKSLKKDETYVFIPNSTPLSDLPEDLIKVIGQTEKVMILSLTPEKKMARGSAAEILNSIDKQGFHLQMPENPLFSGNPSYKEALRYPHKNN